MISRIKQSKRIRVINTNEGKNSVEPINLPYAPGNYFVGFPELLRQRYPVVLDGFRLFQDKIILLSSRTKLTMPDLPLERFNILYPPEHSVCLDYDDYKILIANDEPSLICFSDSSYNRQSLSASSVHHSMDIKTIDRNPDTRP